MLACIFTLVYASSARAQITDATQVFDRGTQALHQGAYSEAITIFGKADSLGFESPGLYYNRAVAFYRLDQIGQSIRYLRRARALDGDDPRIQHSLSIVSERIEDKYSELPAPIWKRLQRIAVESIGVNTMIALGVGFYLAMIFLIIMRIRRASEGPWQRRLKYFCTLNAFLFLFGGFSSSVWPAYPDESVVVTAELLVREQPDSDASISDRIHEGLVVSLLTRVGDWVLIQLPNGAQGWITGDGLGAI